MNRLVFFSWQSIGESLHNLHREIYIAWKQFFLSSYPHLSSSCESVIDCGKVYVSQIYPLWSTLSWTIWDFPTARFQLILILPKITSAISVRADFPFCVQFFSSGKYREKIFLAMCPTQLNCRTRRNRNATFCFHVFFSHQSVMIAFIKMKKCKIKFHWVVNVCQEEVNLWNEFFFATWIYASLRKECL